MVLDLVTRLSFFSVKKNYRIFFFLSKHSREACEREREKGKKDARANVDKYQERACYTVYMNIFINIIYL